MKIKDSKAMTTDYYNLKEQQDKFYVTKCGQSSNIRQKQ